jgi:hypothetical protein
VDQGVIIWVFLSEFTGRRGRAERDAAQGIGGSLSIGGFSSRVRVWREKPAKLVLLKDATLVKLLVAGSKAGKA